MKKAVLSFIILLNLGLFAQEYSDYVLNYPNGNIKEKGVLHLGLKEGTWEYYSPDGKLMAKVDYHKDMLHGENIIYYSDGKVKEEYNYWANERHGRFYENYQNGKPSLKGFYHSNLKDSVWQVYCENGNPQLEVLYRKGLRIKILNAYDLVGKQIVKDGNGQMINYFNSLKIQSQGNLEDGVEQGLWTFYYEN